MSKHIFKTGKRIRPKTAVKGKRYRCALCRRRSPKPVKTPAPWYCPNCLRMRDEARNLSSQVAPGDRSEGSRVANGSTDLPNRAILNH